MSVTATRREVISKVTAVGKYDWNANLRVGKTADGYNTPFISMDKEDDEGYVALTIHLDRDEMIELAEGIIKFVESNC